MTTLVWSCGVTAVAAICLVISGLRRKAPMNRVRASARGAGKPLATTVARLVWAATAGIVLGLTTGWPVAAMGGFLLGFFGRELLAPRTLRHVGIERTEAIAIWTEQLRDTMAAAAGLQQAIVATAPLSPQPIRKEVTAAAESAARKPLVPVLLSLAEDLADPTADLVITALVLAASGQAQDLGEILSTVASSARDDATMRRYVDASRARTRTAVRTITAVAVVTVVGLLLVGHGYLRPYSSLSGQLVLVVVLACYGAGVAILQRMGREKPTERILSPAVERARP